MQNNYPLSFFKDISQHRTAIMGISMLSIMLFHQYFTSVFPFNIFHNFGHWGVDLFLFLSGMGLVNSLKRNSLKVYYQRRFFRLAPACIICGTIKYIAFLLIGAPIALGERLEIGWWSVFSLDLWFIYTIIIYYAISPLLYKLLCHKNYAFTLLGVIFLFYYASIFLFSKVGDNWMTPIGLFTWTAARLPVFTFGMLLAIRGEMLSKKLTIISAVCLLFAVIIVFMMKAGTDTPTLNMHLYFALAIGALALTKSCIWLLGHTPQAFTKFFEFIGHHSLEIYLTHEFIIYAFILYFNQQYNPFCLLFVSMVLSVFVAYLCRLLIDKISFQ